MNHTFGGDWTYEKLERIRKYLNAYATIMKAKNFRFAYIDAFAGTGYRKMRNSDPEGERLLPLFNDEESQGLLDGSARIALQIKPRFTKYIFIERDQHRFFELGKLRTEFPELGSDIELVGQDANVYLLEFCSRSGWSKNRAVLFLDPYGMQVQWRTIKAIANTKAIDLWILFPSGIGVNRLLKKNGKIDDAWRNKLDAMFGEPDWFDIFYRTNKERDLFQDHSRIEKTATPEAIGRYFVERLKTVFHGVAKNPLVLTNSRNSPMFLLCFAAGNPKGAVTAVKIAQEILGK